MCHSGELPPHTGGVSEKETCVIKVYSGAPSTPPFHLWITGSTCFNHKHCFSAEYLLGVWDKGPPVGPVSRWRYTSCVYSTSCITDMEHLPTIGRCFRSCDIPCTTQWPPPSPPGDHWMRLVHSCDNAHTMWCRKRWLRAAICNNTVVLLKTSLGSVGSGAF